MASGDLEPNDGLDAADASAARLVRRIVAQWPLVVVCAAAACLAGYFGSDAQTRQYQATTTIQLNEVDLGSFIFAQNLQQQGQDAQTKAATNVRLVTLPRVLEAASRGLGGRVSAAKLRRSMTVTTETGTTLLDITARSADPQLAALMADQVRESFIEIRRQASLVQLNGAKAQLTAQLSEVPESQKQTQQTRALRDRVQQIETLRALANGGVETDQTARVPTAPISPNPKRDAALALVAGLLLGMGIAILRARLDDRVRDVNELSELWNLPVLGLIPEASDLKNAGLKLPASASLEAFALARTNLRYLHVGGDVKTVAVTSAVAQEGKSTVAWNLAVAAALADSKVLLVDADLRRPVLAERLGIETRGGLAEVLAGIEPLEEVITTVRIPVPGGEGARIDVLPAGMVPPSPIALLERTQAASVFDALAASYDLVVVDTPPATVVADAKVIGGYADGVVVVSRLARVRRSSVKRLRELLVDLDTPILGTVVTAGASARSYGYEGYIGGSNTASAPAVRKATPERVPGS
jgi:capsular exopolysaccharide synthesis family protein